LLIDNSALSFANAAAAIIQREDGKYLLQKRDDRPDIWYPDHWGCFGGAIDADESPEQALRRELMEELSLDIRNARPFVSLDFDLAGMGLGFYRRFYYAVAISSLEEDAINLGEGSAIGAFDAQTMLNSLRVTPYDAFSLFLHCSQHRFRPRSTN
jgi:8-oxo-dGTP pyrophosphatase MutT (NUDIX family)